MMRFLSNLVRLGLLPLALVQRSVWDDPFDDPDPYLSDSSTPSAW